MHVDVSKPNLNGNLFTKSASRGGSTESIEIVESGVELNPCGLRGAADQGHLVLVTDILSRRLIDTGIVQTLLHHGAEYKMMHVGKLRGDLLIASIAAIGKSIASQLLGALTARRGQWEYHQTGRVCTMRYYQPRPHFAESPPPPHQKWTLSRGAVEIEKAYDSVPARRAHRLAFAVPRCKEC
ncbi:hypothetical protein DL95DRAFT_418091 [Leptodontidium sp. 2 PMI_412]|nr:hypothetical protein DL95DRAFT_418091 [Leptodontidium sp. 2 PMI_412]